MENWPVEVRYSPWLEKGPYLNDKAHEWGKVKRIREYIRETKEKELFLCLHVEGENTPFTSLPLVEDFQNKRYVLSFDRKGNISCLNFFLLKYLNPDLADLWVLQLLSQFPGKECDGPCSRIESLPRSIDIGICFFHFIQGARSGQLKGGTQISVVKTESVFRIPNAVVNVLSKVLQQGITSALFAFWNQEKAGFICLQPFWIWIPTIREIVFEKFISQFFFQLTAPFRLEIFDSN